MNIEELKAENTALHEELRCCTDRYQKAMIEYEELHIKYADLEKEISYLKGQVSAFQYCASH